MRKIYLILLGYMFTMNAYSQYFTDTKGELQVTEMGSVTYTLPIAMPPSVGNVAPIVDIVYTSGAMGGLAGQGWNVSNVSMISRVASRLDIDGFVDGVDFDDNDKLALDGQRLLIKEGSYWQDGAVYETEFKSNTKIEQVGTGFDMYFIVYAPDGSKSWYGNFMGTGTAVNAYYITRFQDVNGNFVAYEYANFGTLCLSKISFSRSDATTTTATVNNIRFIYDVAKRKEFTYIKGNKYEKSVILKSVEVKTNDALFRKYVITHSTDALLGYERITQIQEFNGQNEASNPVTFEYNTTPDTVTEVASTYSNHVDFTDVQLTGDFDGDSRMDFITQDKLYPRLALPSGSTPATMPFTLDKNTFFTANTLTGNKVNQFHSVVKGEGDSFKVYNYQNGALQLAYQKNFSFPFSGFGSCYPISPVLKCEEDRNKYQEGDFNGDGISDVLIIKECATLWDIMGPQLIWRECGDFYWVDLNPNVQSESGGGFEGSPGAVPFLGAPLLGKRYIADFNGDGKTDILVINEFDDTYKVVSFKQSVTAPFMELEILGTGSIPQYDPTKLILLGDYNGDAKTDIMIPVAEYNNNWVVYFANPNPNGGSFFETATYPITEYNPDSLNEGYETQTFFTDFYALDANGDGKTDLVTLFRRKYSVGGLDFYNDDTEHRVNIFTNNISNTAATVKWPHTYAGGNTTSGSPEVPIPVVSNFRLNGVNSEIILLRKHYDNAYYFQFNKDVAIDNQLKATSASMGNIKHTIDYKPMEAANGGLGPITDFYSSANSVDYPLVEIKKLPSACLVSKLTATINGVSKFQDFKYRGFVTHMRGIGQIGFNRTARSNWYIEGTTTKIWDIKNNDPLLRGANTKAWTNTDANTVFSATPGNLLTTRTNLFTASTNNGLFDILLAKQTVRDHLTDVTTEDSYTYDTYGLATKVVTKKILVSAVQGIITVDKTYGYDSSSQRYYMGRPSTVTTVSSIYPGTPYANTHTAYVRFTYFRTGFKSYLSKTEYWGTGTAVISEVPTYDSFGNVLTKTTSAPGMTAQVISNVYDPTGRFVVKKTDIRGFDTTMQYNALGQLTTSTDHMGATKGFIYDNWGKIRQISTSNASAATLINTTVYGRASDGGWIVTSQNVAGDNTKTITGYDVLGNQISVGTKAFANNQMVYKSIQYDVLGRKTSESMPYFGGGSATQFINYQYDHLYRPTLVTYPSGRTIIYAYNGLSTTVNDAGKTKTIVKDSYGRDATVTDDGGSISYKYFAKGEMREANYGGHKVATTIDAWGKRTSITDPTSGTYSYEYDPYGQMTKQITPKGTYSYDYDGVGRMTKQSLQGDGADIVTTYNYNDKGLIEFEQSKKTDGSTIDSFVYYYDEFERPVLTSEYNSEFVQNNEFTYDTLGRLISKKTTFEEQMQAFFISEITEKFSYNSYNGLLDKIKDGNDVVLWQLNSANEMLQPLTETLGNGIAISNTYNEYNYIASQKHSKNGVNVLYNTYNFNSEKGLLTSRNNLALGLTETFTYDNLDRLSEWTNPATGGAEYNTYDERGRITYNSAVGEISYSESMLYRKESIGLLKTARDYYLQKDPQTVSYNMFKAPILIEESPFLKKVRFEYNSHLSRKKMEYNYGLLNGTMEYRKTKLYSANGTNEFIFDKVSRVMKIRTFIGGDAYTAKLYNEKTYNLATGVETSANYYLHTDYLGSILAITDNTGAAKEKRHFDAWGNLSKIVDQNGLVFSADIGLHFLDRGYTGHEEINEMKLINMNGRLYDPKLRSFLQPDNFIQNPTDTQNFNRYCYVLNNPLKYTDPSGEEFISIGLAVVIGAVIAATTYSITAAVKGVPITGKGFLTAAFLGACSGFVSFGIGSACSTISSSFVVQSSVQALSHGVFQGAMSQVQGGEFWKGFAAGAISSLAAAAWSGPGGEWDWSLGGNFGSTGAGIIAFGTLSGGAGSYLSGGNFWQGAAIGFTVSSLNHSVHQIKKHAFDRQVDKAYGGEKNADTRIADELRKDQLLYEMKDKIPTLRKLYKSFGKNIKLFAQNEISTASDGAEAKTWTNDSPPYFDNPYIYFYGDSFSSYRNLAHTMLHEFGHAYSSIKHIFYNNYISVKKNWDLAIAMDELFAHRFAFYYDGVTYKGTYSWEINYSKVPADRRD